MPFELVKSRENQNSPRIYPKKKSCTNKMFQNSNITRDKTQMIMVTCDTVIALIFNSCTPLQGMGSCK